jgi:hypothetical protein
MVSPNAFDLVAPDGTALGRVELTSADMFWSEGRFTPTPAFDSIAPLFRAELELLNGDAWEAWEEAYARIDALGLELRPLGGGAPIREFILHVDGESAQVRY